MASWYGRSADQMKKELLSDKRMRLDKTGRVVRVIPGRRSMEQITAGKGRAPKPFMLAKGRTGANAVWHSNRGDAAVAATVGGCICRTDDRAEAERGGKG